MYLVSGTVQILPVLPVCLFNGHDNIDPYAVFLIIYPEENGEFFRNMHTIPDNASRSVEPFDVPRGRAGLFEALEMFPDNTEIFIFESFTELYERCIYHDLHFLVSSNASNSSSGNLERYVHVTHGEEVMSRFIMIGGKLIMW